MSLWADDGVRGTLAYFSGQALQWGAEVWLVCSVRRVLSPNALNIPVVYFGEKQVCPLTNPRVAVFLKESLQREG